MVEVFPQSGFFWYRGQRDAVFFNASKAETLMGRALDTFVTKEEQRTSSARGNGKFQQVNKKVLDACLSKYQLFVFSIISYCYICAHEKLV